MSQASLTSSNDQITQLLEGYQKTELESIQDRTQQFQQGAEALLEAQMSEENMKLLLEAYVGVSSAHPSAASILSNAKELFKLHIGSVIQETQQSLLHGSALDKIGTVLSLTGRTLDGINIFWNELTKKHPVLQVLDTIVIKPLIISFYTTFAPEIFVIKSLEFIGRSLSEAAKTDNWKKSLLDSASIMASNMTKNFEYFFGNSYQSTLINSIGNFSSLDETQKADLKALFSSEKQLNLLIACIENPKTAAASVAGAMVVSRLTQVDFQKCLGVMQEIIYNNKEDNIKINIQTLWEGIKIDNNIAKSIEKVFADTKNNLPVRSKPLGDIINNIQESTKIDDNNKQKLIQFIVGYVVKNEVDKVRLVSENKTQEAITDIADTKENKLNAEANLPTTQDKSQTQKLHEENRTTNVSPKLNATTKAQSPKPTVGSEGAGGGETNASDPSTPTHLGYFTKQEHQRQANKSTNQTSRQ